MHGAVEARNPKLVQVGGPRKLDIFFMALCGLYRDQRE